MNEGEKIKRRAFLSSVATGGLALSVPIAEGAQAPGRQSRAGEPADLTASGDRHPRPDRSQPAGRTSTAPLPSSASGALMSCVVTISSSLRKTPSRFGRPTAFDREYGGYLRRTKKTKACQNTDKDLYSQGRLLWLFSFLYNNFGKNPAQLAAARQGKEALVKHGRVPGGHWGRSTPGTGR